MFFFMIDYYKFSMYKSIHWLQLTHVYAVSQNYKNKLSSKTALDIFKGYGDTRIKLKPIH